MRFDVELFSHQRQVRRPKERYEHEALIEDRQRILEALQSNVGSGLVTGLIDQPVEDRIG